MIQVFTGHHEFTYDHVFGGPDGAEPDQLYPKCVAPLVDGLFRGYNATVFAYGQTGGVVGRHADEGGAACRSREGMGQKHGAACNAGQATRRYLSCMLNACAHGCKHVPFSVVDRACIGRGMMPCDVQKWAVGCPVLLFNTQLQPCMLHSFAFAAGSGARP